MIVLVGSVWILKSDSFFFYYLFFYIFYLFKWAVALQA